jgi:hypothetical protein
MAFNSIHNSINIDNGASVLFDIQLLKNKSIDNEEDVLLMLLPDFSLQTALHSLLINVEYDLFNKLTCEFNKIFQSFMKMDMCIDKVLNMFIYIIQNVSQYPFKALEDIYCKLPFYASDDIDIDDEDEKIKKICKSIQTSEKFLIEGRRKIGSRKLCDL